MSYKPALRAFFRYSKWWGIVAVQEPGRRHLLAAPFKAQALLVVDLDTSDAEALSVSTVTESARALTCTFS